MMLRTDNCANAIDRPAGFSGTVVIARPRFGPVRFKTARLSIIEPNGRDARATTHHDFRH